MSSHNRQFDSPRVVNIADLRRLARRRLPRAVFGYLDGGAEDEVSTAQADLAYAGSNLANVQSAVLHSRAERETAEQRVTNGELLYRMEDYDRAALILGETTIKTHLLHIYTKLGVRDRASAVATAYKRGLLG